MRFHWYFVQTKDKLEIATQDLDVGAKICGLQNRNQRPQTIELTRDELKQLIDNKHYLLSTIIPSLAL